MGDAPELVALLAAWQREARELLPPLRSFRHPDGVLPTPQLHERARAVRRLRRTMMPRESRKQRHLWPALRHHLYAGDEAVEELMGSKRAFEHRFVKLRWADERADTFDEDLGLLVERVHGYLACEERLTSRMAAEIPHAVRAEVARRLQQPSRFTPTQVHPDLPAQPWAAAVLAPVVAVTDRARDWFTTAPG